MRRSSTFLAAFTALALAVAPGVSLARAGGGSSFGSRGMRTYIAPPVTRTAPFSAAPIDRSLTPRTAPGYSPSYATPYRSGFGSGFLGGLLGIGLGSLLFGGHGFFGGFFSLLIWLFVLFFLGRLLLRVFARRQPAYVGVGNRFARAAAGPAPVRPMPGGGGAQGVAVTRADYKAFEQILYAVQAAWSAQNLNQLQQLSTPEMASNFADQLAAQSSRAVRNEVRDVHLDQGDLAEAWIENGREYATVAMRFSMIDVTRDVAGRIVEGDPSLRTQVAELWTFLRVPGGRWVLSAIQQTR
ncbi:MAG: TIM44-like domain-containing protein [Acetobacteraceae bacterium]|nr:TIM44-like domain-containing protein [Acetobacteraceae bacterium]